MLLLRIHKIGLQPCTDNHNILKLILVDIYWYLGIFPFIRISVNQSYPLGENVSFSFALPTGLYKYFIITSQFEWVCTGQISHHYKQTGFVIRVHKCAYINKTSLYFISILYNKGAGATKYVWLKGGIQFQITNSLRRVWSLLCVFQKHCVITDCIIICL